MALQNLPVLFAIDRAGLVGPDGPTHAGSFDFSYMRCLPNLVIMAPADENECRQMLYTGFQLHGPPRYAIHVAPGLALLCKKIPSIPMVKAKSAGRQKNRHSGVRFHAQAALEAAEQLNATVVNMRFVKPLETAW